MIRNVEPNVAQGAIDRPRKHNIRTIINAIRYIMRGGCQWSKRFSVMEDSVRLFSQIVANWHDVLVKEVRKMVGKNETPSVGIINQ